MANDASQLFNPEELKGLQNFRPGGKAQTFFELSEMLKQVENIKSVDEIADYLQNCYSNDVLSNIANAGSKTP